MHKHIAILSILLSWTTVVLAQTIPAVTPAVNNARLKVVGQNMHNYFLTLSNSFSECTTQAQLDAKTAKIAQVFAAMDADVYAMCELEVSDTVVGYITRALNEQVGENRYAYVHDGLEAASVNGATKVGFIYRIAMVTPLSSKSTSSSGGDGSTYGRRMRWIGFKENATNETFIVSMNHFRSKASGDDQGESQRITNAANLVSAMNTMKRTDPDILVLGDLNCTTEEQPIQNLIAAGLEEQLERFNTSAYSYYYQGGYELIDHAMANESCAEQIIGAGVCHISTQWPYNSLRYSDHDLYMVGLNLGQSETALQPFEIVDPAAEKMLFEGRIYILRGDRVYDSMGRLVK